jgi:hypothetical protein
MRPAEALKYKLHCLPVCPFNQMTKQSPETAQTDSVNKRSNRPAQLLCSCLAGRGLTPIVSCIKHEKCSHRIEPVGIPIYLQSHTSV